MAPIVQPITTPSLQRLLSLDKDFEDLNKQIRQAAQIIGLPGSWYESATKTQPQDLQRAQNHARAEWVLRWIQDKLRSKEVVGVQARANIRAWKLLEQAILLVPVPNAASLLRTADYPGILERALEENFGEELHDRVPQNASCQNLLSGLEVSESSATAEEHPKPSRKRKRPVSGDNTPTKKVSLGKAGLDDLFVAISRVLEAIIERTRSNDREEQCMVAEYMKMVLRVRTAQAAKLLRFWLNAIHTLLVHGPHDGKSVFCAPDDSLRLSSILRIWELRTLDFDDDSGASANAFSTECLIPTTVLLNLVRDGNTFSNWESHGNQKRDFSLTQRRAVQLLEQLFARHVFGPARIAFFADTASTENTSNHLGALKAKKLQGYLDPLYIKLSQAASLERIPGSIPKSLESLFRAIPQLLEIAIRCSPRLTPKKKNAEMPWIQAAFIALVECSGCPLHQPEFPVAGLSIAALCDLLAVIASQSLSLDSTILEEIFRFHSGMFRSFLENGTNVQVLMEYLDFTGIPRSFIERSSSHDFTELLTRYDSDGHSGTVRTAFQQSIIIPLMKAFARNRNLVGFIAKWHTQLSEGASITRVSAGNQGQGKVNRRSSVWEDEELLYAMTPLLRSSLTLSQISGLLEQHRLHLSALLSDIEGGSRSASPLRAYGNDLKSACGSIIVIDTLLGSIHHDETVEGLKSQLDLLRSDIVALLEHDRFKGDVDTARVWESLSRIYTLLWTIGVFNGDDLTSSAIQLAQKSIPATKYEDNPSEHEDISFKCHAGIEAFIFILTVCNNFRNVPAVFPSIREQVNRALSALLPFIAPLKDKAKNDEMSSAYSNIKVEPLAGKNEFFRDMEVLFGRFPILLEFVSPDARAYLFLSLCSTVLGGTSKILNEQLLQGCSEYVFSNLHSDVRNDLLSAFFAGLDNKGLETVGADHREHGPFATSEKPYFDAPLKALSRKHREAVLDRITEGILEQENTSCDIMQAHFALMAQLMETPNATAKISTDPQCLFGIAARLDEQHISSDVGVLQVFGTLVQRTLRHILSEKERERSKQFLRKFAGRVQKLAVGDISSSDYTVKMGLLKAVMTVVGDAETVPQEFLMADVWNKYIATAARALTASNALTLLKGGKAVSSNLKLDIILDALTETPLRITAEDPGIEEAFQEIQLFLSTWMLGYSATPNPTLFETRTLILLHKASERFKISDADPDVFLQVSRMILRLDISAQEYRKVLDAVQNALMSFDISTKLQILPSLLPTEKDEVEMGSLRILHAFVSTLKSVSTEDPEQKQQLSALLPTLCSHLAKTHDIASFNALLDNIQTILRDKSFLITQHGTEALLAALTTLATPTAPSLPPTHASAVYTRLCQTTHTLLTLHRARLGGRFHLLMPLLQALLSCLFTPNNTPSAHHHSAPPRPTPHPHHPPWLSPTSPLPPRRNRLHPHPHRLRLPPPSAVAPLRQRDRAALTDATKRARALAALHAPVLLAHFCRCVLGGRVRPEVRARPDARGFGRCWRGLGRRAGGRWGGGWIIVRWRLEGSVGEWRRGVEGGGRGDR
ncbi:uncharacterized protein K441DRAFT_682566 [Cenococcum geophilum 1.58]|uniref:Uncharacterized protein n=1 Tax=Cenococcum geophilum 1.58 TaxID=794803 RepID=A0ACC8EMU5_9PEZI|nr:hypothetical protein K441DRAFT_682566 [Cenococcum geophilum 1.58]